MNGWIGVDFDGTLAQYGGWVNAEHCGEPIAPMLARVKRWLAEGHEVRIFTARVWPLTNVISPDVSRPPVPMHTDDPLSEARLNAWNAAQAIRTWSRQHIGLVLPITCVKDYGMVELWDDRAVQVRPNTGEPVGQSTRGLE